MGTMGPVPVAAAYGMMLASGERTTLLGRPLTAYTRPAIDAALEGDLTLARAEHHRMLLLETTPQGDLVAGPGVKGTIRIDGQEVEVGAVAGKDRRPWWRRLFG